MGHVTRPIGVVTGLQVEADIARAIPDALVLCFGPGPAKAEQAAMALLRQGALSLMSFGIAGGLDPAFKAGDLVCSPATFAQALGASAGRIATVAEPALTRADKAALYQRSGACAVDMETSAVQGVAQAHGLPFLTLRAICDTAHDSIPRSALKGVSPDGAMQPMRVAGGLFARPQDLPALVKLGKRQKAALAALKFAVKHIGTDGFAG